MTDLELRQQITELGTSLFARGFSVGGAGNITARLSGETLLATPTNSCLGRLSPETLALADMDGRHLDGAVPTKELPLHLAIYRAKPECRAVVHLHSTYATALSCLERVSPTDALRAFTPYYIMKINKLPVIAYYRPGSPDLAKEAAALAPSHSAFLLANHGCVVCGKTLAEAVNNAEELEETARLFFVLRSSGEPVRYLTEGDVAELRGGRREG